MDKLAKYVKKHAINGSLREVLFNFFHPHEHDAEDLPRDNKECKRVVEEAMELYLKIK